MRYCSECAHYDEDTGLCALSGKDPITGKLNYDDWHAYPTMQRVDGWFACRLFGTCGAEARFFERRIPDNDEFLKGLFDTGSINLQ